MKPLLNAIYSRFTADSTLTTAFPGGLQRDMAPEGTPMPYVVSHVVSAATELAYGGATRTRAQMKFSAIGIGHDAIATTMQSFTDAFDSMLLTLSTGINDSVARLGDPLPVLLKHDAQGNDVWEWSVVYEYGIVN